MEGYQKLKLFSDAKRQHQKKKARWLWAAARVTGGLSALPATYASHRKRDFGRLQEACEHLAEQTASKLEQAQALESTLSSCVQAFEAANNKRNSINNSTASVVKQIQTPSNLVTAKCAEYTILKEEAMTMAAKTRKLQAHVEMLEYTDGEEEVKGVMESLIEDIKGSEMARLAESSTRQIAAR
ncbi:MAG: hypothetical protein Q9220_007532 [cf. Caloplaca sp. 1 TL-2023]